MVRMDLRRILKPKIKPRTTHPKSKEENVYTVVVMANAAAVRNRLDAKMYELHLNDDSLSLHVTGNKKQVVSWPYFYIRRYGPDADKFHLEAGRKCETGEGLFSFKCFPGEAEIIHASLKQIFNKLQALKLAESASQSTEISERRPSQGYANVAMRSASSTNSTHATPQDGVITPGVRLAETEGSMSDEEELMSPELPPRKYRNDTKTFREMLGQIEEARRKQTDPPSKPQTKKVHFNLQTQSAHKSNPRSPEPKPPTKLQATGQLTPSQINDLIRQHRETNPKTPKTVVDNNMNDEPYQVLDAIRQRKISDKQNIYNDVIYEE